MIVGHNTKSALPFVNSDCHNFATDYDVDKLRVKMLEATKDDDRLLVARKVFRSKCFSTKQIRALSEVFTSDAQKFKFLEAAYPFVSDEHFPELSNLLWFWERSISQRSGKIEDIVTLVTTPTVRWSQLSSESKINSGESGAAVQNLHQDLRNLLVCACTRAYETSKCQSTREPQAMSEKSQERLDARDSSQIERQLLPRFHFSSSLDVLYCQYVGQDTFQKKLEHLFCSFFTDFTSCRSCRSCHLASAASQEPKSASKLWYCWCTCMCHIWHVSQWCSTWPAERQRVKEEVEENESPYPHTLSSWACSTSSPTSEDLPVMGLQALNISK